MTAAAGAGTAGSSAAADATRYACVGCGARWRYDQVRAVARCRACGGGLWALDREARPVQRVRRDVRKPTTVARPT